MNSNESESWTYLSLMWSIMWTERDIANERSEQHSDPQCPESQSVAPRRAVPPREPTPRHPYRVYGYKVDREWFAKFAKDHNIGKPHWGVGAIESGVLGYLTLRLPGFQIHAVDNPLDTKYGYSICICLATNWNRKKLERAASRVPIWMEMLGTEEKPLWYKPTVETIPPICFIVDRPHSDLADKPDSLEKKTVPLRLEFITLEMRKDQGRSGQAGSEGAGGRLHVASVTLLLYHCLLFNLLHTMSEQQPSASQTSAPVEPQSTDSEPQSVLPPPHKPLHPPTPPHPYRIYGYKVDNEWFAKFAKYHNIGKPDWDAGAIESGVLGYLTRLPGFQIHFVDDPSVPIYGYSICISLATNWYRKKLQRAASRVPKWMEILGTEEKPRWYKPTVDTIPPITTDLYTLQDATGSVADSDPSQLPSLSVWRGVQVRAKIRSIYYALESRTTPEIMDNANAVWRTNKDTGNKIKQHD
ncbi:hypothetical protein V8E55_008694 [Tylopilus felleus]